MPVESAVFSVLLAEDDDLVRRALKAAIERHGHRVVAVADGDALLAALGTEGFSLCAMDAFMPGPSLGLLLQKICLSAPGLPLLVISGLVDLPERLGVEDVQFLAKPVSLAALDQALRRVGIPTPAAVRRRTSSPVEDHTHAHPAGFRAKRAVT